MSLSSLLTMRDKVRAGEPLSRQDGVALFQHPNLIEVGALANEVRERLHGDRTYFNRNLHINATNVCVASCMFCSFARLKEGDQGAYTMKLDEAWAKLQERVDRNEPVTEIHIVNGLHDGLPFDYYTELLAGLKRIKPSIHLKAFTAVEIFFFHKHFGMPVADVIARLRDAGLGSLPGGGAEIFAKRVRALIAPGKEPAEEWFHVHDTAHRLGIPTHCTLLYGHVETYEERVDHMLRLRAQQDETGGFLAFIPLAFHPENTVFERRGFKFTTGADDLKMTAVSRLLLDNIPNIKAYWIMMGLPMAQIALHFGANDVQGTVVREKIFQAAGATSGTEQKIPELVRVIKEAGRIPVQRDTLYNELARW